MLSAVAGSRADDLMAGAALALCAAFCLTFRYLPMVDLPQHHAMVSILLHHDDPAWGFAQRYTFDFFGRPYATVYWLGAALGLVMPLRAAMHIVVAACTVAPLAGAHVFLVALRRPRVWLLPAVPFAFGSLWHWGFLNFLLGTGIFLAGLAVVVRVARKPSRAASVGLGAMALLLLFTHFHGLVMLLVFAPLLAWAHAARGDRAAYVRSLAPLAPAAVAAAVFVLVTWSQAEGQWVRLDPGTVERVRRFAEFLSWGLPGTLPWLEIAAFGILASAGLALGGEMPRSRLLVALGLALGAQVAMYLLLPLNTNTATYVSARHALLVVIFVLPLLPSLRGRGLLAVRLGGSIVAAAGLVMTGEHLACFDREASDFDGVISTMQPARRLAPLIFARGSACCDTRSFPYLHFGAYYQAAKGGDLSRSFAVVWNVPIRYRTDYARYPYREELEWQPGRFSAEDARHFDYVLMRGGGPPPPRLGLREIARSGMWSVFENPAADPAELPLP
jgi:hypothetical protein